MRPGYIVRAAMQHARIIVRNVRMEKLFLSRQRLPV